MLQWPDNLPSYDCFLRKIRANKVTGCIFFRGQPFLIQPWFIAHY